MRGSGPSDLSGAEQLPLSFSEAARTRVAEREAQASNGLLFEPRPVIDVHLHSPREAVAQFSREPDHGLQWLQQVVGPCRVVSRRRASFPAERLDRLVCVRPPVQVTLDAAALVVGRALWADTVGWPPLRVRRSGRRLYAASARRWPRWFSVRDAPWTAVQALLRIGVPLEIDSDAKRLMSSRVGRSGDVIARAGLAGSAVRIETTQPSLLEQMGLPALAYDGDPSSGRYRMPVLAAGALLDDRRVELSDDLRKALTRLARRPRPKTRPEGVPWELYSFQARDVAEASRILATTGGVLLAAEMGAGKTVQALTLAQQHDAWPLLVVAPLSAFTSWEREVGLMGKRCYTAVEPTEVAWPTLQQRDYDVAVVSYDRLHSLAEAIEQMDWGMAVADEVQRVRTPSSRRSRALRRLSSAFPLRVGLSGTPMVNRVDDLLPIGAFLVPGEWRPRRPRSLGQVYVGDDPTAGLAEHLSTIMVRRRKEDTGLQLVAKRSSRVSVELSWEQKHALAGLEAEAREAKRRGELPDKLHVFARLQRARQIIEAPAAAGVAGPSPKVDTAVDIAKDFVRARGKLVVFTTSRPAWEELTAGLRRAGVGWAGIWGSTPSAERKEVERRFHEDPEVEVVVATIQSTSEGVTFSPTGKGCLFVSMDWSPSTLAQAEARVHRLNATDDVEAVYLHASWEGAKTLDDRIAEVLRAKQETISRVVDRRDHHDDADDVDLDDLLYMLTG